MIYSQRRFLCIALFLGSFALLPPHSQAFAQSTAEPSAAKPLLQGMRLLKSGKRFEKAAQYLEVALKTDLNNIDIMLALACATASRAHTLSRALAERVYYERYAKAYNDYLHRPADAPPKPSYLIPTMPALLVPDAEDNHRLRLTDEEAKAKIERYCLRSRELLDKALQLCASDTPRRQAEVLYTYGWTLLLFWQEVRRTVPNLVPSNTIAEMTDFLDRAAKLLPGDQTYLRAQGESLLLAAVDAYHPADIPKRGLNTTLQQRGISFIEKTLERTPEDGSLWAWLAFESLRAKDAVMWRKARMALDKAIALLPANAHLLYNLAGLMEWTKETGSILPTVEKANAFATFTPTRYRFACPKLLQWAFPEMQMRSSTLLMAVLTALGRQRENAMEAQNSTEAVRITRALLRICARYATHLEKSPNLSEAELEDAKSITSTAALLTSDDAKTLEGVFPETEEDARLIEVARRYDDTSKLVQKK